MTTASCPGFLDRDGIWNNGKPVFDRRLEGVHHIHRILGFDCSSPRICCGTETSRFCCVTPSFVSSSTPLSLTHPSFDDTDSYTIRTSNHSLTEKWFVLQLCTIGIVLALILLILAVIYLCLTSLRHSKDKKKRSMVQLPLPSASSFFLEPSRSTSRRMSTISCSASSEAKSRCTDTSTVFHTPLNLYPTSNSRSSTASSSSYYVYPNDFEYLCK